MNSSTSQSHPIEFHGILSQSLVLYPTTITCMSTLRQTWFCEIHHLDPNDLPIKTPTFSMIFPWFLFVDCPANHCNDDTGAGNHLYKQLEVLNTKNWNMQMEHYMKQYYSQKLGGYKDQHMISTYVHSTPKRYLYRNFLIT